jgi:hypothetical protein
MRSTVTSFYKKQSRHYRNKSIFVGPWHQYTISDYQSTSMNPLTKVILSDLYNTIINIWGEISCHRHGTDELTKRDELRAIYIYIYIYIEQHSALFKFTRWVWKDSSCHTKQICSEIKFIWSNSSLSSNLISSTTVLSTLLSLLIYDSKLDTCLYIYRYIITAFSVHLLSSNSKHMHYKVSSWIN